MTQEARGGVTAKILAALFAALLASLALVAAFAVPARAQLAAAGPVVGTADGGNGFPTYYQDSYKLKLQLCLDANPICGEGAPAGPVNGLTNFPEEAAYWGGDAVMPVGTGPGGRAVLAMSVGAAFVNGPPADGEQMVLNGIVINLRGLDPNTTYTVTHPYGVDRLTTGPANGQGSGRARLVNEAGCDPEPPAQCDFNAALAGPVDPFLVWAKDADHPAPPAGYVGDPGVEHAVAGSPNGTNFFQVQGPNAGGPGVNVARTNLFSVVGKVSGLAVLASPRGGTFGAARSVSLASTDPAADIFFTTDGSDPLVSATRIRYTGPVNIAKNTRLRFAAANGADRSPVFSQRYNIRSFVSLRMATKNLKLGRSRTISGAVRPDHTGKRVKVTIRKPGPDAVRNARLTAGSSYSLTYKPPVAGRYRVQVSFADADHVASKSVVKSFRAIR